MGVGKRDIGAGKQRSEREKKRWEWENERENWQIVRVQARKSRRKHWGELVEEKIVEREKVKEKIVEREKGNRSDCNWREAYSWDARGSWGCFMVLKRNERIQCLLFLLLGTFIIDVLFLPARCTDGSEPVTCKSAVFHFGEGLEIVILFEGCFYFLEIVSTFLHLGRSVKVTIIKYHCWST